MSGDEAIPAGRLAENVVHFVRVLRAAGLPVGPDRVLDALQAAEVAGVRRRDDLHAALASVLVDRHDQLELFDQAFRIFWKDPALLDRVLQLMLPHAPAPPDQRRRDNRRLSEALAPRSQEPREPKREKEIEVDARLTFTDQEVLRKMDFESMSAAELARAQRAVARMQLPLRPIPTRRTAPDPRGRHVDLGATLRASARSGGMVIPLRRRSPRTRPPALVVLCDISGSMSRYSRMFLQFLHAAVNERTHCHVLLFGTRLTNVTPQMRSRDPDVALRRVSEQVQDWAGGTRIGACLREFNLRWSRRLLGQGAVVLLVTDGLDRDAGAGLEREIDRLHKSCRRLIWLNPLLRYAGFEARAAGVRALLPHVDEFRPVHSLESFEQLAQALASPASRQRRAAG
ncbi:MAG TPA: VWA domain-containing protein [Gammaproteobacteria bacterium]|nr:VWA domain-containing protein [Gammaproteobacteria bacterium]